MKMKSVPLTLLAISILAGIMLTPSHASFVVNIYAQTYNTQYTFTVPTHGRATNIFGATISPQIGTDIAGGSYSSGSATIAYAVATYQPLSLTSSVLQIVEIVLLGIAVVMHALVFMGIGKLSKK